MCWDGKSDVHYEAVPDPKILDPRDRASLEDKPALYKQFRDKESGCIKVVMKP